MNEHERGELMGLRLIVAWMIGQAGQSTAFDGRFGGAGLDALLQEIPGCNENVPLSNGIRSAVGEALAWKEFFKYATGHDVPPS